MKIMISGITSWDEAWNAIVGGAHGLGFVLEPNSVRYINPELAREIILQLPPLISTIGVFKNTPRYIIQELTTFCRLDWLLLLGQETPKECEDYRQPIIKSLPNAASYGDYESVMAFLTAKNKIVTKKNYFKHKKDNVFGLYLALDDDGNVDGIPISEAISEAIKLS